MTNHKSKSRVVELPYADVRDATIFVELGGAEVSGVTPEGEVLFTQGLLAGRVRASDFLPFMEQSELLLVRGHFTAVAARRGRTKRVTYGEGATRTGARPDWRPRTESKFEREMRATIGALTKRVQQQDEQLDEARRERRRVRRAEQQAQEQLVQVVEEVKEPQETDFPSDVE